MDEMIEVKKNKKKDIISKKIQFVKAKTVYRYVDGLLIDDVDQEKRIDRNKNPFVKIEKKNNAT